MTQAESIFKSLDTDNNLSIISDVITVNPNAINSFGESYEVLKKRAEDTLEQCGTQDLMQVWKLSRIIHPSQSAEYLACVKLTKTDKLSIPTLTELATGALELGHDQIFIGVLIVIIELMDGDENVPISGMFNTFLFYLKFFLTHTDFNFIFRFVTQTILRLGEVDVCTR
jgi:hypothetical protein